MWRDDGTPHRRLIDVIYDTDLDAYSKISFVDSYDRCVTFPTASPELSDFVSANADVLVMFGPCTSWAPDTCEIDIDWR